MSFTVEKENQSVEHCGLMYHDYDDFWVHECTKIFQMLKHH